MSHGGRRHPTFAADCLAAARAFVSARGPEAPWDDLADDLPDIPLGSAYREYTTGMPGTCDRDEGSVTHGTASFLDLAQYAAKDPTTTDCALGALFAACVAVGKCHFSFRSWPHDGRMKSDLCQGEPPGTRIAVEDFEVARGESVAHLEEARNRIVAKLFPWSAAFYGDLPGVLGIAAGFCRFQALFLSRDGTRREIVAGSFGNPAHAVKLARLVIAAVAYARVRVDDEKWVRDRNCPVWYRRWGCVPRVEKAYDEIRPNLVDFYAETRDVPGLERGEVRTRTIDGEPRVFYLTPLGCVRRPHPLEARTAMKQIAETVAAIHSKGWAHRDLRWANIVLECCKEGRRWTVIDCEYASRIGTPWEQSCPPKDGWNEEMGLLDPIKANDETVTVHRDYWMLGRMIAGLDGIRSDGELVGIGEQLWAFVDDAHPDDNAANKARELAFERLRALK